MQAWQRQIREALLLKPDTLHFLPFYVLPPLAQSPPSPCVFSSLAVFFSNKIVSLANLAEIVFDFLVAESYNLDSHHVDDKCSELVMVIAIVMNFAIDLHHQFPFMTLEILSVDCRPFLSHCALISVLKIKTARQNSKHYFASKFTCENHCLVVNIQVLLKAKLLSAKQFISNSMKPFLIVLPFTPLDKIHLIR